MVASLLLDLDYLSGPEESLVKSSPSGTLNPEKHAFGEGNQPNLRRDFKGRL